MDARHLSPLFARVRKDWSELGDSLGLEILARLEHEERMIDAWKTWGRHCSDLSRFPTLLGLIRTARDRADKTSSLPEIRDARDRENVVARNAVRLLLERFSGPEWPDTISPNTAGTVAADMQRVIEFRKALEWAGSYLDHWTDFTIELLDKEFPASQKRSSPAVSFQVLLCTAINNWIGTPLYGFVAIVTDAVYQQNEYTDPDSVRAAWTRDKEKRATRTI